MSTNPEQKQRNSSNIQFMLNNSKTSLLQLKWNSPGDGKSNIIDFSMVPTKSLLMIKDMH